MPTYIYETIPSSETEQPKRFEVRQSMNDKALTHHPDSGTPVRRVIVGGTGVMGGKSSSSSSTPSGGGSCGSGCGCH
jgi:predicted nucleic acid-binding Zn ribbon protein